MLGTMSTISHLSRLCGRAFAAEGIDPSYGEVTPSQRPELSQFQCNGALAAARQTGRPPREMAEAVAAHLRAHRELAEVGVAGPGFINLTLSDRFIAEQIQSMEVDPRLGATPTRPALTVVVDYAGPNVAKPMHVGHLRATIIGDSLLRIMRFLGHRVIGDPHFGDWGLQMGQVIAEIERRQPDLPYFDASCTGPYPETPPVTLDDLQEIYPLSSARSETDTEWAVQVRKTTLDLQQGRPGYVALWRHMKAVSEQSQRQDFRDLGVDFDLWYGESDVQDRVGPLVKRLLAEGTAKESQGAVVIDVNEPDDNRDLPPFILATSRGAFLYSATDLATVEMRVEDLAADLILYVVDARQSDHFLLLFRAARRAGIAPPRVGLEHIRFGTMNGKDGKPFRTRAGGVVSLRDLIELVQEAARRRLREADIAQDYPVEEKEEIARQVGIAALKFGDLINNRQSDYLFDLDRFSAFEGKTGPYLQYGAVRIRSIQRKAAERGLRPGRVLDPALTVERDLMLELLGLEEAIMRAANLRAPHLVADYAFGLASRWSRFYDVCHILSEPDGDRQASWLTLADLTLRSLTLLLDLLGIKVPERM
jgi:arginyl-tRNA synthetase